MGFDVARTGVASVGFIGFPSVGKSTLMSKLTGQHSEAAAYEFTTVGWTPLLLGSILTTYSLLQYPVKSCTTEPKSRFSIFPVLSKVRRTVKVVDDRSSPSQRPAI